MIEKILKELGESPEMGCILLYIGRVKGVVGGKKVKVFRIRDISGIRDIEKEIREKYKLEGFKVYHREGDLKPGEDILMIGIGAKGRGEAIGALKEAIERIKVIHEAVKEEEFEE